MILTRAPLRIPLGGGGTDFPSYYKRYGGFILGFAIDKYVHCVIHDTVDSKIRLKYSKTECVDTLDKLENRVAAETLRWYGVTSGIEVATFSDVPECSGLGGSSSFCVALVLALRHKLGMSLNKYEVFASAYDIERNCAGQPGGMQDQFFASFGGSWKLLLNEDFLHRELDVSGLVPNLKLIYTNTSRMDLRIAERQTEKTSSGDQDMVSNLDKVKAMGQEIESCLSSGNFDRIGEIFGIHWENKKSRDDLISSSGIDLAYEEAMKSGASGGKLLGLGGGGYLLMYSKNGLNGLPCINFKVDTEGARVVYES